jgi:glutaredoxin
MATKRKIETFSARCVVCNEVIDAVSCAAGPSCEVIVLDMENIDGAERARSLGGRSVPAVLIDGKLADCCAWRGVDLHLLRAARLGNALR